MIYDRTAADVAKAINIRKNKVSKGVNLTEQDLLTMERGSFTINTANRIEDKQSQLKALLADMGYYGTNIVNVKWELGDVFFLEDLVRIVDNTSALRKAFMVFSDTPTNPRAEYHYREVNLMEKVLYDLGEMVDVVKKNYRECGAFNCGEA